MGRRTTLLVGNGLNLVSSDVSWTELIRSLCPPSLELESRGNDSVPLPIQFEVIAARGGYESWASGKDQYLELKKKVRDYLARYEQAPNSLHERVGKLPIDCLVTTNYDYAIESSLPAASESYKRELKAGTKYLFESTSCRNGVDFYHAHGVQDVPSTICIGYEHYLGYVQKMRSHFLNKADEDHPSSTEVIDNLVKGKASDSITWPDLFFCSDVYIVGLGLGFSEIDLWWLLTLRAAYFSEAEDIVKASANRIVYYDVFKCDAGDELAREREAKHSAKAIALDGLHVEYAPIAVRSYSDGYHKVLNEVENTLQS